MTLLSALIQEQSRRQRRPRPSHPFLYDEIGEVLLALKERINEHVPKVSGDNRAHGSRPEFIDGGRELGVIASVTEPFYSSCTRARLTADGKLVTCLFSDKGHDLKSLIRSGATDEQLTELISSIWSKRTDRYSDERLAAMKSRKGYQPKAHHKIEMITLGG